MEQHQRIIDELKTFERLCLEQAQESTLPLEQAALLEIAANCRAEAARWTGLLVAPYSRELLRIAGVGN
ncbi:MULTISPECIES: hypothetical protein [unclassified Bradyrhizobium]|jgi:hypothetical protein|uniref:hypothetical protein n=1 Tax=unclassified Bradyrhizobium TaxID=2631580 RepID=UPI001FF7DC3A|nr:MULTISPECIES: hypothetical protein [unclassified Bradyrhizobium]MCK1519523.1 hypothetical protein [Bradyrhizobium sp. 17]MCK1691004.1 hypothetical protein [Bradyrhizobium sp. 145]UPJ70074.1 hypothetical protein IVB19_20335 [Bradyrhizobium sp. 187]